MQTLTQPTLLLKPFAEEGDKNTIPVTNSDATNPQLADLTNGFPEITSLDPDDGGIPAERKDFNGLGYLTTTYDYFYQAGGTFTYNATIADAIGGYPLGARLWYSDGNGNGWILRSTKGNNKDNFVSNPTSYIGTSWVKDTLTTSEMDSRISSILSTIYPIGSIYIGTQGSCPMSIAMPGTTWEMVATNRALWGGNGTNGNTTIAAGLPAIPENGSHSHPLTQAASDSGFGYPGAGNPGSSKIYTDVAGNHSHNGGVYGASNTVQPPAYVVNVWRRTA